MLSPPALHPAWRSQWLPAVLLFVAAIVALRNVVFFFPRAVDDLFISLRYADNLVLGHGLVYNPGEWVEGYSSLSWVLLQALGIALGLDGVTATKLWALVATAALFVGLYRLGREVFELPPAGSAVALMVVGANSYVISWCMYGLETPLHLALFVWFAVWVRRVSDGPARPIHRVALAATGIAFALTRPEAPLLLAAIGPGAAGVPRSLPDFKARLGRLLPSAGVVVLAWGAWLVVRRSVYGLWVPHTYYAKQGSGLEFANLEPLWSQGAPLVEQLWWPTAAITVVLTAVGTRRLFAPLLFALGLFFIVRVEMDWMPNMRHFLPLWLVSTFAVVAAAHAAWQLARSESIPLRAFGLLTGLWLVALTTVLGGWLATVDSRFSPYDHATHGRGETWIRTKTADEWSSVRALLRRVDPPGYEHRNPDQLGLIQQTFVAIEASARPEHETWFLGRDIGMIGYYSPMQIWDTDGLFTPAAIRWTQGLDRQPIEDGAIEEAFSIAPVAGEIYFEWMEALGRNPHLLEGYEVTIGSRRRPYRFVQSSHERPDVDELQRRYARVIDRLPRRFHFSELYGNPASPAIELRARVVVERARLAENVRIPRSEVPPFTHAPHTLDSAVVLDGCTLDPVEVAPGERSLLRCYFRRSARVNRDYRVFVHGDSDGRRWVHGDHAIAQGAVRLAELDRDEAVESRAWLSVPADTPEGPLPIRVGLFDGDHRASVRPSEGTDGDNRIDIGHLRVRAR